MTTSLSKSISTIPYPISTSNSLRESRIEMEETKFAHDHSSIFTRPTAVDEETDGYWWKADIREHQRSGGGNRTSTKPILTSTPTISVISAISTTSTSTSTSTTIQTSVTASTTPALQSVNEHPMSETIPLLENSLSQSPAKQPVTSRRRKRIWCCFFNRYDDDEEEEKKKEEYKDDNNDQYKDDKEQVNQLDNVFNENECMPNQLNLVSFLPSTSTFPVIPQQSKQQQEVTVIRREQYSSSKNGNELSKTMGWMEENRDDCSDGGDNTRQAGEMGSFLEELRRDRNPTITSRSWKE